MKKILLLLAAAAIVACGTKEKAVATATAKAETEKTAVKETVVVAAKDASGNLTGIQSKDAFMQAPFSAWFQPRYDAYTLDAETAKALKKQMKDVEIRAYMGTWCGDSKRETPRFYKLLDEVDYDMDDLTMITVDRSKRKPEVLVSGYDVIRVPTFIFYRDGKEIGRYVERPRETLEKDFLKIVSGETYKHSYDRS